MATLGEEDLALLRFAAEQRLFAPAHIQVLLGVGAPETSRRLRGLVRAGLLEQRKVFHGQPPVYAPTRLALRTLGETIAPPRLDLAAYAHDLGVAWLWLAASRGAFGAVAEVISERRMRSQDTVLRGDPLRDSADRTAVRLAGAGPSGRARLHYPDLVLVTEQGQRIGVELELSGKGRARRERILLGYGGDRHYDAVLYLVDRPDVARAVQASARKLGLQDMVHVQPVMWGGEGAPGVSSGSATRTRARTKAGAGRGADAGAARVAEAGVPPASVRRTPGARGAER